MPSHFPEPPEDEHGEEPARESQPPPLREPTPVPHPLSSVPPPPADAAAPESERPPQAPPQPERRRFESKLPGLIRRGIEKGIEAGLSTFEKSIETGRETTDAMREVFSEVKMPRDVASAVGKALQEAKLPREIAGAVFNQIDETKNDVLRIVAKEVRDFLDATDLASEIKAALTSLSFEVRTEIRFIPNDAGSGVKPDVKSRTRVKRTEPRSEKRRGRASQPPDREEEDGDEPES
ncbi:MAG: hypothetical protein QM778_08240 [Myxococcales bacterium]